MSLDPAILALLAGPVAICIAGRDQDLRPSLCYAYGCRAMDSGAMLRLILSRSEAGPVLRDIAANGHVAAVFSDVRSFRTLQIKGIDARVEVSDPADRTYSQAHCHNIAEELVTLGYAPGPAQRFFTAPEESDCITIAFSPAEVFQQTPGPNAGARLRRGETLAGSKTTPDAAS
ncbi:MAG: pyridoxamine 5'-phosphate oxidase family protein [Rhodospirillaceae bacterium]|nr:pyridoxamine 5'-phosphate oxidase family protein [Rhodospirillaceae bacterium]